MLLHVPCLAPANDKWPVLLHKLYDIFARHVIKNQKLKTEKQKTEQNWKKKYIACSFWKTNQISDWATSLNGQNVFVATHFDT